MLIYMQKEALYMLGKEASSEPLNQFPNARILHLRVCILVNCKMKELTH